MINDESLAGLADTLPPIEEKQPAATENKTETPFESGGMEDLDVKPKPETPEIKEETKVEVKAETKPEVEEEKEEKSVLKNFWDDDDSVSAETKSETKEEKPAVDEDVLKKAGAYEAIVSDPVIDAYLQIKTSGKDIKEFVNLLSGVDPKTMTPEQLYRYDLKKAGLSDEDIEIEMAAFEELRPRAKQLEVARITKDIEAEQADKLKRFKVDTTQEQEALKRQQVETIERLDRATKDAVGQEWFGLKITEEMANAAKGGAMSEYAVRNPDGTYNVEESLKANIKLKYFNLIVRTAVSTAKNSAKEEVLKKVSNPSLNETSAKPVTASPSEDAKKEAVDWFTNYKATI